MSEQTNEPTNSNNKLQEERGIPSVNDHQLTTNHRGLIALFVVVGIALTIVFLYSTIKKHEQKNKQEAVTQELHVSNAPARTFDLPTEPDTKTTDTKAPPKAEDAQVTPPLLNNVSNTSTLLDKSASSLMVGSDGSKKETDAKANSANAPKAQEAVGAGAMDGLLSSTTTTLRSAAQLSDRNMLLAKGSFIDCVLQTKLDSTVPGMTSCTVTRNIYSDNGKVLLIERGSQATGEYQANLKQGQARIFVLWSRIKTPNGVVIALDSPGTDPLGGAGLPGYVDTHFWERFGGALMLSLVQDAFATAASNQNNNSQVTVQNTSDATENMAAEALKSTINIPPTLYKNQGDRVAIYVARDLDFGSVYDLASQ